MKAKFIVNEPYVIWILVDRKLRKKFKGIAKCLPGDVFNEQRGKDIAKVKAEINRDRYRARRAMSAARFIERRAETLVNEYWKRVELYDDNITRKYLRLEELVI